MDAEELLKRYSPFVKKHWLPIGLGLVGLIFLGYGLIGLFSSGGGSDNIIFESSNTASDSAMTNKTGIFVDISGAVVKPGVYQLKADSRLQDGLIAAGGLSAQADRDYIAKNLNLAIKLKDGTKVYIPDKTQNSKLKTQNYSGEGNEISVSGFININTATLSELDKLPGIGPVTAQKIVDNRPYGDINELLSKKIVSSKVFEQIKEKITSY